MKSATDTTPSIPMSLIILGAPGTGKTTLATQFPKAYFLNADNNIEGSIRWLKDNNRNADFFYDDISSATKEELSKANIPDLELKDLPTEGECIVKRQWKYRYMAMLLNEAVGSDKIKTIVLDSLTSLTEVTLDEVRRQAGRAMGDPFGAKTVDDMLQRQDWGANMSLVKNLIFQLMGSGKRLVLIGHLKIDKDELTGIMQEYIAIPGQLSTQIALWFGLFLVFFVFDIFFNSLSIGAV